jgi:hypothetical protein
LETLFAQAFDVMQHFDDKKAAFEENMEDKDNTMLVFQLRYVALLQTPQ